MSALNRRGGQAGFRHRFEEGQQEGRGVGEPCDGTGAVRPVPFSSRFRPGCRPVCSATCTNCAPTPQYRCQCFPRKRRRNTTGRVVESRPSGRRGRTFESCRPDYTGVHRPCNLRENYGFLGDCCVSAPNVRRAAIPCGSLHRRKMRLSCTGFCSSERRSCRASRDSHSFGALRDDLQVSVGSRSDQYPA